MENPSNCLNCDRSISENFCPNCGQKANIHRYSLKHFVTHDLIHGIWHVDNGIFFTIKELFTRPGHSVREFINGKRVGYFSFVSLLLIILAMTHFFGEYALVSQADLMPEGGKDAVSGLEEFAKKYPKTLLLLTIPLYSVFSFLWFRKAKLNLTEHFVLNSYKTVVESLMNLLFVLLTIFYSNIYVLTIIFSLINILLLVYAFWFYKQFFSAYHYSKASLILRSLGVIVSYMLFSILFGIILGFVKSGS